MSAAMSAFAMLRTASLAAALLLSVFFLPQDAGKSPEPAKPAKKAAAHVEIAKIAPRSEDVSSIDGIIKAYYEVVSGPAGQPRQWERDATLYIPNVRFVIITEDAEGNATAKSMTHQEFADSSDASLGGKAFYEHEKHRVIHRVGSIAHVLITGEQATAPNGPFTVSGLDSLELLWDGKRWWIAGANLWEINAKKHPMPAEFLP